MSERDAVTGVEPMLRVEDLEVQFRTKRGLVRAVDGVSFEVMRGRTLGIVGESGSGKTVLSRSILGLVRGKNVVRRGRIIFDGKDLTTLTARESRAMRGPDIAMVFQDPMTSLNPIMRVGTQITEGMKAHLSLSASERKTLAIELLRSVGIPAPEQRLDQYPFELSGGMRQRIIIAIALSCNPDLLLADEPTTALDVTIQAQILELLDEKKRERNMAMTLVTHDLGVVGAHTDDTIVMYAGKIVERAPTAELFERPRMPYTHALLRSIPRLEEPSHTPMVAIEGRPPLLTALPKGCRFAPRFPRAQPECREHEPPLMTDDMVSSTHSYACWYPVDPPSRASTRTAVDVEARGVGA